MEKSVGVGLSLIDIVGPFHALDACALIMREPASGRIVALSCSNQYANSVMAILLGDRSVYSDMSDLVVAFGGTASYQINVRDGVLYSTVWTTLSGESSRPIKIVSDSVAMSICMASCAGQDAKIAPNLLETIPDCRNEYICIQERIAPLFPLPCLGNTEDLETVCNLMDKAR